ncbi:hypothetical protein GCM10010840_07930 [Deinococcus aerolatus]|uniref:Uncharacterized protein n=2 Tax=Deinococcus aerolatus TaxID=522487 RepID=A0ABQ2G2L6_9DEIO|nr:hypothetical protein GCM10010840_07930 [Deinococcus aerolatus]
MATSAHREHTMHFDLQYGQQRAQDFQQEAAQASRARQARPAREDRPRLSLRALFQRLRPA